MNPKEELKVSKIKEGIVIDKLTPYSFTLVLDILGVQYEPGAPESKNIILPLVNVYSNKMKRRKDMLKIEGNGDLVDLVESNSGNLALISDQITISEIKDWKIVRKYHPEVPNEIKGILNCPRHNCVSHEPKPENSQDHYESMFYVVKRNPLTLECNYCPTRLEHEDIIKNLVLK